MKSKENRFRRKKVKKKAYSITTQKSKVFGIFDGKKVKNIDIDYTASMAERLTRVSRSGAGPIFGQGGARPRSPKSGTRNSGLRWNWRVFLSRKQEFSK